MNRASVAVVVPMHRATRSAAEEISLRALQHHLSDYPFIAVVPEGFQASLPGFAIKSFAPRHFSTPERYNELLVTKKFYRAFEEFAFILVFQLDCLVFANALGEWCSLEYDYIGAPWVENDQKGDLLFVGVGNGGFSLRRVHACLEVLRVRDRNRFWTYRFGIVSRVASRIFGSAGRGIRSILSGEPGNLVERTRSALKRDVEKEIPDYENEDLFWTRARDILPAFRIPDPKVAVSFAFETEPRFCYEQNGHQLPFGCHDWEEYDRSFWEAHIPVAVGDTQRP